MRAWKRGCECESRSTRGRRRWNFYWSTWFISFFTARPLTGIFLLVLAVLYFLLIFLKFFFFFYSWQGIFYGHGHVSPAGGKMAAHFGCDNCNCHSSGKKVKINEIKMQVLRVYLVNQCNWHIHLGTENCSTAPVEQYCSYVWSQRQRCSWPFLTQITGKWLRLAIVVFPTDWEPNVQQFPVRFIS